MNTLVTGRAGYIGHHPCEVLLEARHEVTVIDNLCNSSSIALERAQIASTIAAWPQGYQTLVGERGVRLSGGQRQRLAIARALYKRADVLVFDEATSALDDATEDAVLQAIEALGPELTIILITHRLRPLRATVAVWRVEGGGVGLVGEVNSAYL